MKKSITLIICLWSAIITQAQQDSSFFEVGINAFRLVDRVLGGTDRSNINPYLFTAEYSFGKIGIRTGLDINHMSRKDLSAPVNGNTTLTADQQSRLYRQQRHYRQNLDGYAICLATLFIRSNRDRFNTCRSVTRRFEQQKGKDNNN